MTQQTLTGKTWVAFGPSGAVGSIHSVEGGYTVKMLADGQFRGTYPDLTAARGALVASLPPGSERPEFVEH